MSLPQDVLSGPFAGIAVVSANAFIQKKKMVLNSAANFRQPFTTCADLASC